MTALYKTPAQWKSYFALGAGGLPSEVSQLDADIYNALWNLAGGGGGVNNLNSKKIAPVTNSVPLAANFTGGTFIAILGEDASGNMIPITAKLASSGAYITNGTQNEKANIMAAVNNPNFANNNGVIGLQSLIALATTNISINLIAGHGLAYVHFYYANGPTSTT